MSRHVTLPLLLLALAGCAQTRTQPQSVPSSPRPVIRPDVPIPPAPPQGAPPTSYLNLPPANLRALLGQPQFVRSDGGTEMWRYDGASCRAFFFFQGAKGGEVVRHVETLPAGASSAADPLCLSALRTAAASRPAT